MTWFRQHHTCPTCDAEIEPEEHEAILGASVKGYTGTGSGGGAGGNTGSIYIDLKPKSQRSETADEVIARLRRKLTQVPGARLYLQSVQDIRMGGRASNAQYQFTLQGESTSELYAFVPRLVEALENSSVLADVNSDQ
jgi:multidrug efflux pump